MEQTCLNCGLRPASLNPQTGKTLFCESCMGHLDPMSDPMPIVRPTAKRAPWWKNGANSKPQSEDEEEGDGGYVRPTGVRLVLLIIGVVVLRLVFFELRIALRKNGW